MTTVYQRRLIQQKRNAQRLSLTRRELEVMETLARVGGRVNDAAAQMDIAYSTVRNHLQVIYAKLRVGTMIEAYVKLGWLVQPEPMEHIYGKVPVLPQSHLHEDGQG